MEIIKRGIPPSEYVYKAECTKCGSILKYTQKDLKLIPDPRDSGIKYWVCPVCNKNSIHNELNKII